MRLRESEQRQADWKPTGGLVPFFSLFSHVEVVSIDVWLFNNRSGGPVARLRRLLVQLVLDLVFVRRKIIAMETKRVQKDATG